MNNSKFKKNFRRKILLTSSIGLFLACLSVALISVLPLYNQLKDQQANNLIFAVKTRSMVVEAFLEKATETAKQITSRSQIREFLEKYNNKQIDISSLNQFTAPKLHDAMNLSEFTVGISRFDKQGKLVVEVGLSIPENFLHSANIKKKKPTINGPVTINNNSYILVSAPILDRQQIYIGMDIVVFEINKLGEIVQDYTGLGKTGETILGRLSAKGYPDLFFQPRSVSEIDKKNIMFEHLVLAEKTLRKIFKYAGEEKAIHLQETQHGLAAYGPIEGTDWGLIVLIHKDELFAPISGQVLTIVFVVVFGVIPIGLLALISLLRPLSDRMIIHVDTLNKQIKAKEKAIHERLLAEEKLLDEKERLNVTLRSIGDGVITTDLDGTISFMNKIGEQLTGWSQQDAIGKYIQEVFNIINEINGKPCENPVNKILTSGKFVSLTNHTTLIAKNGTHFSVEDSGAPILDKDCKKIGTVLVFRNVTEKRKTSEELLKIKKLESVGVLAGGIAHDFNNILTAILGNIELAGMAVDPSSEAYSLLHDAKRASVRAKDLTQQLLTFSKGGDPVKKSTPIDKTIIDSANFVLHGSSVSCQFNIPENLWLVDIDSGQISQVIQNLILNAKHAMPKGGEIKIKCSNITDIRSETQLGLSGKKYVKITVQDIGCGITENHMERIFDPYFTTKQKGSGLGLAITHSIINKHNGHISVRSHVGEGTIFTIYLPASNTQHTDLKMKEVNDSEFIKGRILVMDDDQFILDVVEQMLSYKDYEVLVAKEGKEAIKIFNEQRNAGKPVDVIIMDLTIPGGMGGKDTVQEILKIDPDAKVIVSSGYSNDPVMADYQKFGFRSAIAKPFKFEKLNNMLQTVLNA